MTWLYGPAGPDPATVFSPLQKTSQEKTSMLPSILKPTSIFSIARDRQHVNFNEQVTQFISLEITSDEDPELKPCDVHDSDDSDSDDGLVMKCTASKSKPPSIRERKASSQPSVDFAWKTIAMLSPTKLKMEEDCFSLATSLEGTDEDVDRDQFLDFSNQTEEPLESQRQLATLSVRAPSSNQSGNISNEIMLYKDTSSFDLGRFFLRLVNLAGIAKIYPGQS